MVDLKKNYVRYSSRSIPTIIFNDCNDLILLLGDWLGNDKAPSECIGLLMYKLGILSDENDVVEFRNFNKDDFSFKCVINNKDIYTMRFKNLKLAGFNPEIVLSNDKVTCSYVCIPKSCAELGMRVVLSSRSVYENDICFTRYFSTENAVITVSNNNYILEFGVSKPKNITLPLFDRNGRYSKYDFINEEELVKYITGLEFPVSIIDVYREICKISSIDDSEYPRVLLKVSKLDEFGSMQITDLVHLESGELESFGMTILGTNRKLILNKDGSSSYEVLEGESLVKITTDISRNKTNYNISISDMEDVDSIKSLIESNMMFAKEDINTVKVLVRGLFKGKIRK